MIPQRRTLPRRQLIRRERRPIIQRVQPRVEEPLEEPVVVETKPIPKKEVIVAVPEKKATTEEQYNLKGYSKVQEGSLIKYDAPLVEYRKLKKKVGKKKTREYAKYSPRTVYVDQQGRIVKEVLRDEYTSSRTGTRTEREVYNTKITNYNPDGSLQRVQKYDTYGKSEGQKRVYREEDTTYKAGVAKSEYQYRSNIPPKPSPTITAQKIVQVPQTKVTAVTTPTKEGGTQTVTREGRVIIKNAKGRIIDEYYTTKTEAVQHLIQVDKSIRDRVEYAIKYPDFQKRLIRELKLIGKDAIVDVQGNVVFEEDGRKTLVNASGNMVVVPKTAKVAPTAFTLQERLAKEKRVVTQKLNTIQNKARTTFEKQGYSSSVDEKGNLIMKGKGRQIIVDIDGNFLDIPITAKTTSLVATKISKKLNLKPITTVSQLRQVYQLKGTGQFTQAINKLIKTFDKAIPVFSAYKEIGIITDKRKKELIKEYSNIDRATILRQQGVQKGIEGVLQRAEIVKLENFNKINKLQKQGKSTQALGLMLASGLLGVGKAGMEITYTVKHPIKAAKGMWEGVRHPIQTIKYMGDDFILDPIGVTANFLTWEKALSATGKLAKRSRVGRFIKEEIYIRRLPKPFQTPIRSIIESSRVQRKINPNKIIKPKKVDFLDVQTLNPIEAAALKKTLQETDSVVFGSKATKILDIKKELPKIHDVDIAVSSIRDFYEKFKRNIPKEQRKLYVLKKEKVFNTLKNDAIFDIKPMTRLYPDKAIFRKKGWLPSGMLVKKAKIVEGKIIPKMKWIVKEAALEFPTSKVYKINKIKFTGVPEQVLRKGLGTIQALISKDIKRAKDPIAFIKLLEFQIRVAKTERRLAKTRIGKARKAMQIRKLEEALKVLRSPDFIRLLKMRLPQIDKLFPEINKIKPYKPSTIKKLKTPEFIERLKRIKGLTKIKEKVIKPKRVIKKKVVKKIIKKVKPEKKPIREPIRRKILRKPSRLPSKLPISKLRKLSPSVLSRLPPSRLRTLPPSVLSRLPPSRLRTLPPSVLSRLPPSALSKLPQSKLSRLPPSALSKLPQSKLSKLPPSALSKLPSSKLSKLPPSRLKKIPSSILRRMPISKLKGMPIKIKRFDEIAKGKGIDVYIKKRGRKTKYVKINYKPMDLVSARNFGRYIIDNLPLASYRLRITKKRPKMKFGIKTSEKKFRPRKDITKLPSKTVVEKRKYRIDTIGEKVDITMKGIKTAKTQGAITRLIRNAIARKKKVIRTKNTIAKRKKTIKKLKRAKKVIRRIKRKKVAKR